MEKMTTDEYRASVRGKRNRRTGETAEAIARRELERMGIGMLERVHTPWGIKRLGKRIISAYPKEKVSGDFRGIELGGRSVLVEVKEREDGVLSLSDFAPHQREALSKHHLLGGLSMFVWVYNGVGKILKWPADAPVDGRPLKWEAGK